ncbi:MAG TPA: hypothetical protein VKV21_18895 [Solirubrobacteraceae bacterium]|nr:hypothetical protein [Solirubrobacteraceae bacterium]
MSASRCRWGTATAILAVALLAAGAAAGRAAPLRDCTPRHGTIVAVDFAHWGGPIVRGCGVGARTGYALLHAAGFTTAGDAHDGPGIVCRIGDAAFRHGTQYPTPSQESCVQTPPTTAYWAFWLARPGSNHWSYSPLGAMGDVPRPGEVELWIFGATNVAGTRGSGVPRFSPATLRAHAAARTHRTRTEQTHETRAHRPRGTGTNRPRPHRARAHRAGARAAHTSTTGTERTSSTATTTTTARTRRSGPARHRSPRRIARRPEHRGHRPNHRRTAKSAAPASAAASPTASAPTATTRVLAARPTNRRASTGSATPLIVGAVLVLLLCAGAARAIRRRRHEE